MGAEQSESRHQRGPREGEVMRKYRWHGFKITHVGGEESLHVGMLPGRKRVCLYRIAKNCFEPLAYFITERKAYEALRLIGILARTQKP
jgi:hypothetical protein